MRGTTLKKVIIVILTAIFFCPVLIMAQPAKLSPARVGQIGVPLGKIAYIRDGDVWVMEWDGRNQMKVVTAQNADGRLSWAPDGKRIAFVRKGQVDLKGPDGLGGQHKVYDIFIAYLDSVNTNTNFWRRITDELGGRHPEWQLDGKRIAYTKDLNAQYANAILPNYQICRMDTVGGSPDTVAYDKELADRLASMPTFGPNNQCAFILHKEGAKPVGMVVAPMNLLKNLSDLEIKTKAKYMTGVTAPAWSPDGNWIAVIQTEMANQGIFIVKPDLTEKFLVYKPSSGQTLQTYPLSWSPDSKWLTFAIGDGSVWIIDITGNGLRQIAPPGNNLAPAWSKTR